MRFVSQFQNSFLLVQRVGWIDESERSDEGWTAEDYELPRAELHSFDRDGEISSARSMAVQEINIQGNWCLNPREILYKWPVSPRRASMGILPLSEIALSQLSDARSDEMTAFRNAVVERVFVRENKDWLFPQHFVSILYIEPTQDLLAADATKSDSLELIKRLREELHQTTWASVPQFFEDLIVFPGVLGPSLFYDLLVLRRRPLNHVGSTYALPKSVLQLMELMEVLPRLETERSAIAQNPLLQKSPGEYLTMLTSGLEKREHGFFRRRNRTLSTAYRDHLRERVKGIDAYASVRSLTQDYEEAKAIYKENADQFDDDWLWVSEAVSNHKHRYGMIYNRRSKLIKAGEAIERVADELSIRERAVSEYLRDYFNADVAHSNLAVQRAVHRLTIIALLVALIALLTQLSPETFRAIFSGEIPGQ